MKSKLNAIYLSQIQRLSQKFTKKLSQLPQNFPLYFFYFQVWRIKRTHVRTKIRKVLQIQEEKEEEEKEITFPEASFWLFGFPRRQISVQKSTEVLSRSEFINNNTHDRKLSNLRRTNDFLLNLKSLPQILAFMRRDELYTDGEHELDRDIDFTKTSVATDEHFAQHRSLFPSGYQVEYQLIL